jgi:hypothetical protein
MDKLRELVVTMRRSVAKPMFAWETGQVIAASDVEMWADELEAALASLPAAAGPTIGPDKRPENPMERDLLPQPAKESNGQTNE